MEYIDSSVRDAFKTKATENGRSTDYINLYMLIYEFKDDRGGYDWDKREKYFHDLQDFVKHFEGEGIVGSNSDLRDWDFESQQPFYHKGDIECISIMAPDDDFFVRNLLDALNPLDYSVEYRKMAPRKITKLPKDAYGTEVEVGDIVVWEGAAHKVKSIISDKTVNKKRMFTRDCVVVRTNNPNKKLGWVEYIDNGRKE
jgi:hypothetical protein